MDELKLTSFKLQLYEPHNFEHKCTIISLSNDSDARRYLYDVHFKLESILESRANGDFSLPYIAYYEGEPIGFIALCEYPDHHFISYGINPEYRHQKLGTRLLSEFSKLMFALFPRIEELTLIIDPQNEYSIKLSRSAGYEHVAHSRYSIKRM